MRKCSNTAFTVWRLQLPQACEVKVEWGAPKTQ